MQARQSRDFNRIQCRSGRVPQGAVAADDEKAAEIRPLGKLLVWYVLKVFETEHLTGSGDEAKVPEAETRKRLLQGLWFSCAWSPRRPGPQKD